jgi:hypothetical protein
MTEASLEQSMTAARQEHVVPGREIHLQGMRGYRFCEVGLITGTSQDNAIANIWNTTGACDPTPEQFDTLDAEAIAREHGAVGAWLNPVAHWMFDQLDVREAGYDRKFGCITGTWMGVTGAATLTQVADLRSYFPGYIYRNDAFTVTFKAGSEVYLLDAPDGEMFLMQSFTLHGDPTLREKELAHLYNRLDLPDGWGFRAESLDQDVEVSSNIDSLAHVLHDDLHNVYLGSDAGRAFSQIWPANARW